MTSGAPAERASAGQELIEIVDDDLGMTAFAITEAALEAQAEVAEAHGNPRLAENFRRAAELTRLSDDQVLDLYELLRPGRSSPEQLRATATRLAEQQMVRCAALIREAGDAYDKCGLG